MKPKRKAALLGLIAEVTAIKDKLDNGLLAEAAQLGEESTGDEPDYETICFAEDTLRSASNFLDDAIDNMNDVLPDDDDSDGDDTEGDSSDDVIDDDPCAGCTGCDDVTADADCDNDDFDELGDDCDCEMCRC